MIFNIFAKLITTKEGWNRKRSLKGERDDNKCSCWMDVVKRNKEFRLDVKLSKLRLLWQTGRGL